MFPAPKRGNTYLAIAEHFAMLFNSWQFILAFLPITFFVYFWLNQQRLPLASRAWLVAASLFFYAFWNVAYLPLILGSMLVNFAIGSSFSRNRARRHNAVSARMLLAVGVTANLGLLAYYKYADFLVENVNLALGAEHTLPGIVLPLAISFFTFQQIAYLVDSYRGETAEYDFLSYALFVTFFPQLIAGPIVHHREMMPQFASRRALIVNYRNIFLGLFIFGIGLFKKVAIADTFSIWAIEGFDGGRELDFFGAWATTLSYTFQLYFDFSGYCDMAIGAALLFNIMLPLNFNSPYKALDIQEFWRRWHITLSRFLRDYLYIPLGGSRRSEARTYFNLLATFVLGGLWHGASWMFVLWGALHGGGLVANRLWRSYGRPLPAAAAWLVTFLFVAVAWVFFRANTMDDALRVLGGMLDLDSAFGVPVSAIPTSNLAWGGWLTDVLLRFLPNGMAGHAPAYCAIAIAFVIISQKNAFQLISSNPGTGKTAGGAVLFSVGMYFTLATTSSVFLYFNF